MDRVKKYFPIINWAPNYNGQWAIQEGFNILCITIIKNKFHFAIQLYRIIYYYTTKFNLIQTSVLVPEKITLIL